MRRVHLLMVIGVVGTLLSACSQPPVDPPPPNRTDASPRATYGADEIALRVGGTTGYTTAEYVAVTLPMITVYGDGRVITADEQYDKALPVISTRAVDVDAVRRLVALAIEAGVGRDDVDYGMPLIADVGSDYFTISTDKGELRTSVYALHFVEGLTEAEKAARQPLVDLRAKLLDLGGTLGVDAVGPRATYEPAKLAVVFRAGGPEDGPEQAWPGPAPVGAPLRTGAPVGEDDLSCMELTGAEAAGAVAAARTAAWGAPWTWAGQRYSVWLRPLLPEEPGCSAL